VGSSVQHLPAEAQQLEDSTRTAKGINTVVQHHVLIAMSATFNLWHRQLLGPTNNQGFLYLNNHGPLEIITKVIPISHLKD
jgi:hypothetical protein